MCVCVKCVKVREGGSERQVCHVLEGTSTSADYTVTAGAVVLVITDVIVKQGCNQA